MSFRMGRAAPVVTLFTRASQSKATQECRTLLNLAKERSFDVKPDADVAEAIPFQPVEFDLDVDESGPTPVQDKLLREIASKLPGPQSSAVLQALASQDGGNPIIVAWDSSKALAGFDKSAILSMLKELGK